MRDTDQVIKPMDNCSRFQKMCNYFIALDNDCKWKELSERTNPDSFKNDGKNYYTTDGFGIITETLASIKRALEADKQKALAKQQEHVMRSRKISGLVGLGCCLATLGVSITYAVMATTSNQELKSTLTDAFSNLGPAMNFLPLILAGASVLLAAASYASAKYYYCSLDQDTNKDHKTKLEANLKTLQDLNAIDVYRNQTDDTKSKVKIGVRLVSPTEQVASRR